jgi:protein gp37
MGCDGCELWPSRAVVIRKIKEAILASPNPPAEPLVSEAVAAATARLAATSEIHSARKSVAAGLVARLQLTADQADSLADKIRELCKCYAGLLGAMRPSHNGYADRFESPKLFPGPTAVAARWAPPSAAEVAAKPWLNGAPRMIFISDMGDALSHDVPFDYLKSEIVDAVSSTDGANQLWLWLTKRPARMAQFGQWLAVHGVAWPDNLVAMTTVTSHGTRGRVDELRKVPAKFKGLSCEPIYSELNLDLTGIDWVIAGGGSDIFAEPFHVEWALQLRDCCRASNAAFFLKQLGHNPVFNGQSVRLADRHGGEWDEWPDPTWRVREIPAGFRKLILTHGRTAQPGSHPNPGGVENPGKTNP